MPTRLVVWILLVGLTSTAGAETSMFKRGQSMGRVAMAAELCGLPRDELESRSRWLMNWMSKLPREQGQLYAAGVQDGSMSVRIAGLDTPCEAAVAEFRRRTKRLDY